MAAHELAVVRADRSLWLVSALLLALVAYALHGGVDHSRARDRAIAETAADQAAGQAAVVDQLRRILSGREAPDPWSNPSDPSLVGGGMVPRHAVLPTAPLAPLAIGQSDMFPDTYQVTTASRVDFMYDSEIENPWNLFTGRFDLAFVLTYLLPLIIFAWSYNLLASEREHGTLRMLASQPISLRTVALGKLVVRATVVVGWAVAIPAVVILVCRPDARGGAGLVLLVTWAGLIAAYAAFWFALAVLVDSFARSSALTALVLVSSWVGLVLVLPVVLHLAASLVSPAPSRAELATQTRLITIDNLTRFADRFGTDYHHVHDPERLVPRNGRFEVPERMRAFFLAAERLDAEIEEALAAFDTQLAGQQAVVDRLGVLSPAIVVHEGMAALAGNGSERFQQFRDQVTRFHGAWKQFFRPRIVGGIAITEADFADMPRWTWHEQDPGNVRSAALRRLWQLLAAACLLGLAAWWKLGRYPIA